MTLSLSLATFLPTKFFFRLDFLQHHVYIRHRRDYDKQKTVVVIQASLIREMHKYANVANASQRLVTYVQVRFTVKAEPSPESHQQGNFTFVRGFDIKI